MRKDIYILGIGHNTIVFIDLVEQCGYNVAGLYHFNNDRTGKIDHGYKILGSFDDLFNSETLKGNNFALSMGDLEIRKDLTKKILSAGGYIPCLIHPTAIISKFAKIGNGVCIGPFTNVQADSVIGDGTVILSGVNISHTNQIGNFCFISGGATVGAFVKVNDLVLIGISATIVSGKVPNIGKNAIIGAGSVVICEVKEDTIVAGNPAKIISK
jgi:sugar O-acyltransferase (sialic acid O-acetyltransferase NeuD family)